MTGDIILYHTDGTVGCAVVAYMQHLFKQTGDSKIIYTHAAMEFINPDYIIEMKFPEPRIAKKTIYGKRKYDVFRPLCEERICKSAVEWAYTHLGYNYSWTDYLTGYLGIKKVYRTCSGWVARAYEKSGFPLVIFDKLISPTELSLSKKLEQIKEGV